MVRLRILLCLMVLIAGIGVAWDLADANAVLADSAQGTTSPLPVEDGGGACGTPTLIDTAALTAAPSLDNSRLMPNAARFELGVDRERSHSILSSVHGCSIGSNSSSLFLANCVFRC